MLSLLGKDHRFLFRNGPFAESPLGFRQKGLDVPLDDLVKEHPGHHGVDVDVMDRNER